jgi:hypothetical protein
MINLISSQVSVIKAVPGVGYASYTVYQQQPRFYAVQFFYRV